MSTPETTQAAKVASPSPAAAVAKKPQPASVKGWLQSDSFKNEIAKALPSICTPDRFMRFALTSLQRVPALETCTQSSVLRCFLQLAELGIEADGRRAHLIPFKNGDTTECTLILDYKGLLELVRRSGVVTSFRVETVCKNDPKFLWENGVITHEIDWRGGDRGEMQCVYAVCTMHGGETQSATMTRGEVDAIRNQSKGKNSPAWTGQYNEMAKKTVIRRLCKMLPFSTETQEALLKDDDLPASSFLPAKGSATGSLPSEVVIESEN